MNKEAFKNYIREKQFKVKEPIEYFIFEKKILLLFFLLVYIQMTKGNSFFILAIKIALVIYIVKSFKNNFVYMSDIKKGTKNNFFSQIYTFLMKKVFNKGNKK